MVLNHQDGAGFPLTHDFGFMSVMLAIAPMTAGRRAKDRANQEEVYHEGRGSQELWERHCRLA